jgi:hypothetical protein
MKRASTKIKGWMAERRISVIALARVAGIKRETMSDTIWDRRNNRDALQALINAGCPVKWLALPADMKSKQAA